MKTPNKTQELKTKVTSFVEELARETDIARKTEVYRKYLEVASRFHHYSSSNVMLIMLQRPDSTYLKGFEGWKKLNRFVRKNERGISILAPIIYKDEPEKDKSEKALRGFKVVHIFDYSQTDGEPLPEAPDWKSLQKDEKLNECLVAFAKTKGIEVRFTDLPGEIQGLCRDNGKVIEIDNVAGSKTIIHEVGHSLLHYKSDSSNDTAIREMQAESIGFVVAKYFGLENLNSPNYIALNRISGEQLLNHLDLILTTASVIIDWIVNYEDKLAT